MKKGKENENNAINRIDGIIFDLVESIRDIGEEIKLISERKEDLEKRFEEIKNNIHKKTV